ncbi:hypothetical protein [Fructilactobacillus fructivorans]|uniref:hypothetical protein n=1 Tax=Fructilactobacillus fructivorans TaxID=1614 RepID=UPI0007049F34|nr:hypothetical protein [Fructilactobacillus fructivorans]
MASKDVVNTLASKISLDVDDSDLYSLRNELRRTNSEWKNSEDTAKLAGNQFQASASRVGKEKDALTLYQKELEKSKTALKNITGSTRDDDKARQDNEKNIQKLNIQIAKHSNYLEKRKDQKNYISLELWRVRKLYKMILVYIIPKLSV